MLRFALIFGGAAGLLAVFIAAGTAHDLKDQLAPKAIAWVETAVRYQMWHALALLGAGALIAWRPRRTLTVAVLAWTAGIVLFCGTLYLLAFTGATALGLGAAAGGIALLVGWGAIVWYGIGVRGD